jgi:hypothetical protein
MLVFLHASNNNRKETVLQHFMVATSTYGLPSRVRVDQGGENNDVCAIMEVLRGRGRGSAMKGKSVHNQRIERSWVDVWNGATNLFYDLFHFMEHQRTLDIDNSVHMWALHYIFVPRLNRELQLFRDQWNNHGLRTEHHETPLQLFVGRSIELANSSLTAIKDMFNIPDFEPQQDGTEGTPDSLDWEDNSMGTIQVPDIPCPLSDYGLDRLKLTVDPLMDST